jgi:CheY-like chemotaxis protein
MQAQGCSSTGFALFIVEDTGAGISEEHQSKLFIPFEHVRAAVTTSTVGTGLGLSIARRIIALSGGHIGCWSQQGKGSRFWFTVPAMSVQCMAAEWDRSRSVSAACPAPLVTPSLYSPTSHMTQSIYSAHSDGGCLSDRSHVLTPLSFGPIGEDNHVQDTYNHVVVVDDTESNRLLLARLLSRLHVAAEISMAANGAEALSHEEWLTADMWFIDRHMPVMDGLQLCRELRARNYTGPIIAVTGDSLGKHQQDLLDAGASTVLLKPCTKADILRVSSPRSTLTASSWTTELPGFTD